MSVEEDSFSGDMIDERLLTYKRRRVYDEHPDPQEVGSSDIKRKMKTKDIGWGHGEMMNGAKQHWRCNYCGMTRHGGGVTRLKLHLVGHKDVLKCPNVPDEVAKEIARHLFFKDKELPLMNLNWSAKKQRKSIRRIGPVRLVDQQEEIIDVDEADSDAPKSDNNEQKGLEDDMHGREYFVSSLSCMVERHENNNNEVLSADETTHAGTNNETERHAQVGNGPEGSSNGNHDKSWKHALKSMLPLPHGNGNRDSTGIENGSSSGGVYGFTNKALSLARAHNDSQVCMGENAEKCQNALVGILKSDKFVILCDLFRNNFRIDTSAERSYLDFGEIDSKMKNGDYEQSPELFGHDIMKLWKNMEHVGQEMVRLAANLSSISRVNIEDKIGILVSDPDESTDPYSARYCNHCRYEITNDWGLICCQGCDMSYHTSCINPLIHDSTRSWYCSACISGKPDMPVTIGADDTEFEKEDNSEAVLPCITLMYRLCKICGTRADGKKEFLVCSHPECPYKYYHTSCLKKSRIGISMQDNSTSWYCPSCLCRVCRYNKDDPLIVLCDGCDEAYHIYCMDPPCESVPEGMWHCGKCRKKSKCKRGKAQTDMQGPGSKQFIKNGIVTNLQVDNNTRNDNDRQQTRQSLELLVSAIDTITAQED